ncbi:hypothetical protein KI688_003951 [Linnemannia hyalina]|uniref:Crinkler effector protein N-terminal domain-containing protein n=1 Tax=Linnemannia hyalina TaxID=64524 RepID=A0A9P7XPX6_9FUNG|nr:hypothetical protein KI688_003951 [Linnemannia hyalina]
MALDQVPEATTNAFPVEIESTKTIGDLKKFVRNENPNEFRNLTLWHVAHPVIAANRHQPVLLNTIDSSTELDPTDDIADVFIEAPLKKTIHIIVQQPPPGDLRADIEKIAGKFFASGSPDATFLERFVQGHGQLPLTTGIVPGLPRVWLRRQPQGYDERPSLLFFQLPDPSSSNEPSKVLASDAILDLIRKCGSENVPIFGVSGCGKTRSMIELLCRQWGFYFNASGDDLGSDDMTALQWQVGASLEKARDANNRSARTMTYFLLLSRLLILQFCLKVQNSNRSFTSARWTLLQACPHMFTDVFVRLFHRFVPLLQRSTGEEGVLLDIARKEFQATRTCLIEHGGAPQFLDGTKLLVAHDEAQILGEGFIGHFESMNGANEDRPLLSPILYGFRHIEGANELTLLTSGTGLSIYTPTWARSSGCVSKHELGDFIYMEFPGWTNRESVDTYIANLRNFLQDEDAKRALDMLLPSEAIDMMMERLVGRFRPMVTVVEKIIARGEPNGWKDAVDETETRLVSYDYCGKQGNLCHEIVRSENRYLANLSNFKEFRTLEEVLGLLLFQRHMFGVGRLVLREAIPELVERAFGRIKIIDGVARTVLDEPFMRDSDFMKTMESWVQQSDRAQAHGYAWKLMMMSVLIEAFKTRAFSEWPHEPPILSQYANLAGTVVIVGLYEQELQRGISHEHISMEEFMDAHVHNNSMRSDQTVPTFFFPKAKPSGPDIVFYIRVQAAIIPFFVQLKLRQVLTKADSNRAVESVSKQNIKEHVKDLDEYCPANVYVSIIIAYPVNVIDSMRPRLDIDFEAIAVRRAFLRSGSRKYFHDNDLQQVTIRIDQRNFAKVFPKSHVDFLDGIKTPVRRPAVDKQEQDDPKKTKIVYG